MTSGWLLQLLLLMQAPLKQGGGLTSSKSRGKEWTGHQGCAALLQHQQVTPPVVKVPTTVVLVPQDSLAMQGMAMIAVLQCYHYLGFLT
jgi:hypothetical protein